MMILSSWASMGMARFYSLHHLWPFAMIAIVLIVLTDAAHQGWRIAQVLVFVLPILILLNLKLKPAWWPKCQLLIALLWGGVFIADASVRAFLLATYQALPNSALVLSAVANSNPAESIEYFQMYWWPILFWSSSACIAFSLLCWSLYKWRNLALYQLRTPTWLVLLQWLLLVLLLFALLLKPWRRLHPMFFWPAWLTQVEQFQAQWRDMTGVREELVANASVANLAVASEPKTVVLIISDSVNRDNLSAYGYSRSTTPRLQRLQTELGPQMQTLPYAWSLDSATIPALQRFFHFGHASSQPGQHILAMARSAGYRIWWISNHDDLAIEQQHARFSHQLHNLNLQPGRSARNLDGAVIPLVRQAIDHPDAKKLIVVHLLGAHPHYRLRYPSSSRPFNSDEIDRQLSDEGRSSRLRQLRREYDTALYYHDQVLTDLFKLRERVSSDQAWLYFSDHGQEVAHQVDHAGHSAYTPAGYRIPIMLWQSSQPKLAVTSQPVRSDWLGWTLLNLLQIKWQEYQPDKDFLHPDYRWQAPELPITVNFKS